MKASCACLGRRIRRFVRVRAGRGRCLVRAVGLPLCGGRRGFGLRGVRAGGLRPLDGLARGRGRVRSAGAGRVRRVDGFAGVVQGDLRLVDRVDGLLGAGRGGGRVDRRLGSVTGLASVDPGGGRRAPRGARGASGLRSGGRGPCRGVGGDPCRGRRRVGRADRRDRGARRAGRPPSRPGRPRRPRPRRCPWPPPRPWRRARSPAGPGRLPSSRGRRRPSPPASLARPGRRQMFAVEDQLLDGRRLLVASGRDLPVAVDEQPQPVRGAVVQRVLRRGLRLGAADGEDLVDAQTEVDRLGAGRLSCCRNSCSASEVPLSSATWPAFFTSAPPAATIWLTRTRRSVSDAEIQPPLRKARSAFGSVSAASRACCAADFTVVPPALRIWLTERRSSSATRRPSLSFRNAVTSASEPISAFAASALTCEPALRQMVSTLARGESSEAAEVAAARGTAAGAAVACCTVCAVSAATSATIRPPRRSRWSLLTGLMALFSRTRTGATPSVLGVGRKGRKVSARRRGNAGRRSGSTKRREHPEIPLSGTL